jgi:hypothetical protein
MFLQLLDNHPNGRIVIDPAFNIYFPPSTHLILLLLVGDSAILKHVFRG